MAGGELVHGVQPFASKKKKAVGGNAGAPQRREDREAIEPWWLRVGCFVHMREAERRENPERRWVHIPSLNHAEPALNGFSNDL